MWDEGIRRCHTPDSAFYEDGNVLWELERLARCERLHWAANESRTTHQSPNSHEHDAKRTFVCPQCGRALNSAHILALHADEAHSPFFEAQLRRQKESHRQAPSNALKATGLPVQGWQGMAAQLPLQHDEEREAKEGMYRCLEADCTGRFWSPKRRRAHWQATHAFPGKEAPPFFLTPRPKHKRRPKGKKSKTGTGGDASGCDAMDIADGGDTAAEAMDLDCSSPTPKAALPRRPARGRRRGRLLL